MKNLYTILGVSHTATAAQLKKAYRELAMRYHPDRNPGDKEAEANFKQAHTAWETLGNPANRRRYDEAMRQLAEKQSHDEQELTAQAEKPQKAAAKEAAMREREELEGAESSWQEAGRAVSTLAKILATTIVSLVLGAVGAVPGFIVGLILALVVHIVLLIVSLCGILFKVPDNPAEHGFSIGGAILGALIGAGFGLHLMLSAFAKRNRD